MEIKTRVAEMTINVVRESVEEHRQTAYCTANDDEFEACIPSEHRSQVIDQGFVSGLSYGAYHQRKVEDSEGCIMQIVVITIMEEVKTAHKEILTVVGDPLIGWMHTVTIENKGFLEDVDLPTWLDEQSCSVIKT